MIDKINVEDLKNTIKNYYGYNKAQLIQHWSKWKEVEALNQQVMISHDDINDLITESYKSSYQPLNKKQKGVQTKEFLKILDSLIEPLLMKDSKPKMKK